VHDVDLRCELGEEARLLHRGVTAADDEQRLVAEHGQRTVAHRARRHALLPELVVARARDVIALGGRSGRDDQRVGLAFLLLGPVPERPLRQVDAIDRLGVDSRAEPHGLRAKPLAQLGALDAVGEAGEVLDVGRGGELSAGCDAAGEKAFEQHRREVRACCVDRGGVGSGTATNDDDVLGHARLGLASEPASFQRRLALVAAP
jgi:hypothetical protein